MKQIDVQLGPRSHSVIIGSDLLATLGPQLAAIPELGPQIALFADEEVSDRYAEPVAAGLRTHGFQVKTLRIPRGEAAKTLKQAEHLYQELAALPADRRTCVVAVGGGATSDLAGFVAATYARGLPWCVVPTTLLAMVDAAIGGKTGINLPAGKNLVGAFHQPRLVLADLDTLATLPLREFRSGLAEVVKYGFSLDTAFFSELETHADELGSATAAALEWIVARCVELKAQVVAADEFETLGKRVVLNFGHTFAHAFEVVAGLGAWLHGEAVAAGMVAACRLAERLGLVEPAAAERLVHLLDRLQLPTAPAAEWSTAALLAAMKADKKAQRGQVRFVLPERIGSTRLTEVDEKIVSELLLEMGCQP